VHLCFLSSFPISLTIYFKSFPTSHVFHSMFPPNTSANRDFFYYFAKENGLIVYWPFSRSYPCIYYTFTYSHLYYHLYSNTSPCDPGGPWICALGLISSRALFFLSVPFLQIPSPHGCYNLSLDLALPFYCPVSHLPIVHPLFISVPI
jgi:hypothetical protein